MIWQLHIALLAVAVIFLHQALSRASPISAVFSAVTWSYLALLAGSVQIVTEAGVVINNAYESLTIFYVLLALGAIVTGLWALSEETSDQLPAESTVGQLGD